MTSMLLHTGPFCIVECFVQDDLSFFLLNQSGRSVHEFHAGTSRQGVVVLTSRMGYAAL